MLIMNITDAFLKTGTTTKKELAKVLGIGYSAVIQWDDKNLPFSAVGRIHKYLEEKGLIKIKNPNKPSVN